MRDCYDLRMTETSGQGTAAHGLRTAQKSAAGRPSWRARVAALARGVYGNDGRLQVALLVLMLLLYGAVLGFSWWLSRYEVLRMTFNSMLAHMMHGRFDVDPDTVSFEGFVHSGRVNAYWGAWCALLRLPLWMVGRLDVDITVWSFLAATCVAAMAKVRTVLLIRRHSLPSPVAQWAMALMLIYVVLGGSDFGYLRLSIYQEVVSWAAAFGAVFVYLAIKGLVNRRFDQGTLSAMALCAGLALLTRVSTGLGLILALTLLLIVVAATREQPEGRARTLGRFVRGLIERRVLVPAGIMALLVAVTGAVNFMRWGNPAEFADYTKNYIVFTMFPTMLARTATYGVFNIQRIPFGIVYYFFPVWIFPSGGGQFWFEGTRLRLMNTVELPPSSFFLNDLVPLSFIFLLGMGLWRRCFAVQVPLRQAAAIAAGLLAPCILMLSSIFMAYRYRMEFYPEIDLLAFLGLYGTVTSERMLGMVDRHRRWMKTALLVSVASTCLTLGLYITGGMGPPHEFLAEGIWNYYHVVAHNLYHLAIGDANGYR